MAGAIAQIHVEGLDHTAIAADNTAELVAWYQRVLGLAIVAKKAPDKPGGQETYLIGPAGQSPPEESIASGMMLEIMPRNDNPRPLRHSHDAGISHVAWKVADFDAALNHLQNMNVQLLSAVITAVGGGRIISFADGEGNLTQIVERAGRAER